MKRALIGRLGFLWLGLAASAASASPRVESRLLANGARVVVKVDEAAPVVAVRAIWKGGFLTEAANEVGIDRVLGIVLASACVGRSARSRNERLEHPFATVDGIAGDNTFGLAAEFAVGSWRPGLDLVADCLLKPNFSIAHLAPARREVLVSAHALKDDVIVRIHNILLAALFPAHPYGRGLDIDEEIVGTLSSRQLRRRYRHAYPIKNAVIVVVGNISPAEVFRWARNRLGKSDRSDSLARATLQLGPFTAGHFFAKSPLEHSSVIVGFRGPNIRSEDRLALDVFSAVLEQRHAALSGALNRRQAGILELRSRFSAGIDSGYFSISFDCQPTDVAGALGGIGTYIEEFADGAPIPRQTLRGAKERLEHGMALTPSAVAENLALYDLYGLGHERWTERRARLAAISESDLRRVAGTYLRWSNAVVVSAVPTRLSPEAVRRSLGVRRRPRRAR